MGDVTVHTIRLATWNVNWFTRSQESNRVKIGYLAAQPWGLLALQEVTSNLIETMRASEVAGVVAYPHSTDRFASALLARNGFDLQQVSLIAASPQARRAVCAHAVGDAVEFDVVSWHAPNAVGSGSAGKRDGYVAFIDWCRGRRVPLLIGTDANHGSFYTREQDLPGSAFKPFSARRQDRMVILNSTSATPIRGASAETTHLVLAPRSTWTRLVTSNAR